MTTSELPTAPATAAPPDVQQDYRWLIRVWVLVGAFIAVTLYWSHHVGIPVKDPNGSMFFSRVAISIGFFVPMTLIDASMRVGRRGWTVRRTLVMLRSR